ncbi:hypothetical protein ACN6MY_13340 [Peribacillus sp. B-H-3]|uniref:hypothetical protein n=1 Tax=Peribacillus sp. B-H-3 TaxID=3400420 RepID=UPI003B028182
MKSSPVPNWLKVTYGCIVAGCIILALIYTPPSASETVKNATWTELVLQPIVQDPLNLKIFRAIFYLLILVGFFLLIPAGLATLRRFKLFNLEIEVVEKEEVQSAIVDLVDTYEAKSNYIRQLTSQETYQVIVDLFVDSAGKVNILDSLAWFLSDMKLNYKENFHKSINWVIYEYRDLSFGPVQSEEVKPFKVTSQSEHLLLTALSENQLQTSNGSSVLNKLNLMVFPFIADQISHVIVMYDYKNGFDAMDETILETIYRMVQLSADGIEYSIMAKKLYDLLNEQE